MLQGDGVITRGKNYFEAVTDRKLVFYQHFSHTLVGIEAGNFTHEALFEISRMAFEIILVGLRRMTFIEAFGVTAIGQTFQFGIQRGIKLLAGHGIVYCLAINLRGSGYVIMGLGTALDFERVNANPGETFDILDRTQVAGIHNVSAVFVFHDWHVFSRACGFLDQIDLVRQGMALLLRLGEQFRIFHCCHGIKIDLLHIAGFVFCRRMHIVFPTTGIGAGTLVRVAVVKIAR